MAEVLENEEKIFENYLKLPKHVRARAIDKMVPDDRFRLTRCSKLCREEAQDSKNFIHKLDVYCREDYLAIKTVVSKNAFQETGFSLHFFERLGKKYRTYRSLNGRSMGRVELDSSIDLEQCVLDELKRLKVYQGSIKDLEIFDISSTLTSVDFGIECFTNLETLEITGTVDIAQFISKLQKPLKKLCIKGRRNTTLSINHKQVRQVQNIIIWPYAHFDLEQLLRLSATKLAIRIGRLSERNIFHFIRSWQDGSIGRTIESYKFYLHGSNFDKTKFLRLLRIKTEQPQYCEIKHFYEAGRYANLIWSSSHLEFSTIHSDFDFLHLDYLRGSDTDSEF